MWLPTPHTIPPLSRHPNMPTKVDELIDLVTKRWREDVIGRCFHLEEKKHILNIRISRWGCHDKLIWCLYRILSTYGHQTRGRDQYLSRWSFGKKPAKSVHFDSFGTWTRVMLTIRFYSPTSEI
ncbi:hypothetical protein L3X38_042308 [Prunus dulcis]|uniref:Uncharacterized protein n=1 Tax=Prunus dulcis TaxID=3755 RepID=A0AAD4YLG1_PRUDU|nr:hypothetical protein L3X38_042308 [Prunus dulcis]